MTLDTRSLERAAMKVALYDVLLELRQRENRSPYAAPGIRLALSIIEEHIAKITELG